MSMLANAAIGYFERRKKANPATMLMSPSARVEGSGAICSPATKDMLNGCSPIKGAGTQGGPNGFTPPSESNAYEGRFAEVNRAVLCNCKRSFVRTNACQASIPSADLEHAGGTCGHTGENTGGFWHRVENPDCNSGSETHGRVRVQENELILGGTNRATVQPSAGVDSAPNVLTNWNRSTLHRQVRRAPGRLG